MTSNYLQFSNMTIATHIPIIHTIDESSIHVNHVETIRTPSLFVSDAYLVPSLSYLLLFIGQFCDLGFTFSLMLVICIEFLDGLARWDMP